MASRILTVALLTMAQGVFAQSPYDRATAQLSEPAETRWKRFGAVYFRTNEKLLNKFYGEFENAGGVMVGVSFQQNFSLLAHARPELYVMLDINPAVTEILVPFFGDLMTGAPTRREFLTKLLAAEVSSEDVGRLLEAKDARSPGEIYAGLVEQTPPPRREQLQRQWKEALERILDRLPLDQRKRSEALRWQKILDEEEYATGEFFMDSILPYRMTSDPGTQKKLAGWLSTEENYQVVRRYWMEGKIARVTGDIGGPSVGKLAQWLRESGKQVSGIYLSDVGTALAGAGTPEHFAKLYKNLGQLPLRPKARVLISHGGQLTAYSRTYQDAVWLYGYLSDVDYSTFYRLNANVLQAVTRAGAGALMQAFRQEFQKLAQDKSQKNEPIPAETMAAYSQFLDRVEAAKPAIKTLSVAAFTQWARQNAPSLDTGGVLFRTTAATLKDAGAIAGR